MEFEHDNIEDVTSMTYHSCVRSAKLQQCHYPFFHSCKSETRFTCLFWHTYYLV